MNAWGIDMTPTKESPIMMKHYLKDEAVTALDGTTRIVPAGSTVRVYIEQPDDSPTQPQWTEGGLPPVGTECEFKIEKEHSITWDFAKVVGYDGPACVVAVDGYGYHGSINTHDFRPIRTQAEIEREEAIVGALRVVGENYGQDEHPRQYLHDCLNKIYDAGMLRKPMSREEGNERLHGIGLRFSQRIAVLNALNIED